jgi:hypothetical protein
MTEDRSPEELQRLGKRRTTTAIVAVAVVYALVTLSVIAGVVFLAVYLIRAIFF